MMQLNLFDGRKFPITEEEKQKIMLLGTDDSFIELSTGELVKLSAISSVTKPDMEKFWKWHKLDKTGSYFIREGKRIYIDDIARQEIIEKPILEIKNKLIEEEPILAIL
jgi:hypothetical protein